MIRRVAAALLPVVALGAALAGPADAKRKAKRAKAKAPVVTRVAPMETTLGATLTVSGRHFRTGKGRNRVGFKAAGQPAIYLRADRATSRTIKVTLTDALAGVVGDKAKPFRLRVVTSRFGKRYTPGETSPTIGPRTGPGAAGGATGPAAGGQAGPGVTPPSGASAGRACVVGGGDQDGDLLPDTLERRIKTSACDADSDGDGVEDGYEYRSAVDFNDDDYQAPNSALPYPGGKVAYPNPLDPDDADYDFDGDLLTLRDEFRLWNVTPRPASLADQPPRATPLSYSDGLQDSLAVRCPAAGAPTCNPQNAGRTVSVSYNAFEPFYAWAQANGYATVMLDKVGPFTKPTTARRAYDIRDLDLSGYVSSLETNPLDTDGDGTNTDRERDADADGLRNFDELYQRMHPTYWSLCYPLEPRYGLPYVSPDPFEADTDGDGVRDGADDTDRDEYPNLMELSRVRASPYDDFDPNGGYCMPRIEPELQTKEHASAYGWVQPFNPCMPSMRSPKCSADYIARYDGPIWWALQ